MYVLKGIVCYDGTDFAGWQRQPHDRTVQQELESALSRIANRPVAVQGASRTDSGVHALGQVFSCHWHEPPKDRLRHAVSKMLSPEIRVTDLRVVEPSFNARFDSSGKRYSYSLDLNHEACPLAARYSWHVPYDIDMALLESLLPKFVGHHDFAGFQSVGTQIKTTDRTIYSLRLLPGAALGPQGVPGMWRLVFEGDGFLYRMVRNISGTLIEVARGRLQPEFITNALLHGGKFKGHCAPPQGLILEQVYYDDAPWETARGL